RVMSVGSDARPATPGVAGSSPVHCAIPDSSESRRGHPDTGGLFRFRLSVFLHSPFVRVCIFVVAALNWLGPCFSPAHVKMMASWGAAMSLFNLRNLMISRRLLLILLASVLMLLVLGVMMLQRSYRNLHDGKIEQLSRVVQAASGVLREAHERERSGELTRE